MDVCTRTNKPFRDVIGVRYSPLEDLPENPFDSEDDGYARHSDDKIPHRQGHLPRWLRVHRHCRVPLRRLDVGSDATANMVGDNFDTLEFVHLDHDWVLKPRRKTTTTYEGRLVSHINLA
jgi:hypothetical protein